MDERRGAPDARQDGGRFELRVKGHLDARWADWFDGLNLAQAPDGTTVIRGEVADQAALHGLLQTLRDLGLPLISVTPVEAEQRDEPGI
jgi:hypothetical protein